MDTSTEKDASSDTPKAPIAVSVTELDKWGCPTCGYRSGSSMMSDGTCATWLCGECGTNCVILADGVQRSSIGIGVGVDNYVYPELHDHPRRGTPKHGRPDIRPEEGGEYFSSRGIGLEASLTCFACGCRPAMTYMNNIAAFVKTGEAGKRVVAMFNTVMGGARLDLRESSPDRVQVKIGACDKHLTNLKALDASCADRRITSERISEAAEM